MTSIPLIFLTIIGGSIAMDMTAYFDVGGFKGSVLFRRNVSDVNVSVSFTLNPPGSDVVQYDTIELRSLPALFGGKIPAIDVCSKGIGERERILVTRGSSAIVSMSMTSYYHRSVLIQSSSNNLLPSLCGTVLPDSSDVTSFRAKFIGPIFGSLWFRYESSMGAFVYGYLAGTNSMTASVDRKLALYSSGSVNYQGSFADRCNGLTGRATTIKATLSISNTTTAAETFGFLSEESVTSFDGKVLAILDGGDVIACATLRSVSSKTVTSTMNWEGIKGMLTFVQTSPFDITKTAVNLEGLGSRVSGYHVHKYPVPQRLTNDEKPCAGEFVSGHFNPYNVVTSNSPTAGTGSSDQYEIGDLSGKYGSLDGKDTLNEIYTDWNLPLFGTNSIIGRSIVIHNNDGSRLMCATIGYPNDVTTAVATFKSPAYGRIYFRQETNSSEADTTIFVELASTKMAKSTSHNWHVHEHPADDDAFSTTGTCASSGGHFNPSQVSVASPYSMECSDANPFRCELGDLSGRLGVISVAKTKPTDAGKFLFTDEYSPLSGPYSILGRSITIHGPERAAARFACANITQLHSVVALTTGTWFGLDDGDASASITLEQDTEFDPTKVTGTLQGLNSLASGYHIHEFSIPSDAPSGSECAGSSVAGHFMPFGWNKTNSPAAGIGTNDQYEVGDLSGKYGLLDGKNELRLVAMDTNLPLHTSLSSVDRSIVIHKKENSERWKCANLLPTPPSGRRGYVVSATVAFDTLITGTIKLRQLVYEDSGAGLTAYDVNVMPKDGQERTNQHNWHVHIDPITDQTKCGAAAGHYDPYDSISNTDYSTGCSPTNPLYCEVGDLSSKQGRYDIGGGRKLYHDLDSPLHTNNTILGRSIVFHEKNGAAERYTCATIIPDNYTYTFAFPSETSFHRYDFTNTIAKSLGISRLRVIIMHNIDVPVVRDSCSKVMVTIAGGESLSETQRDQLSDGTLPNLGNYGSTSQCVTESGATVVGQRSGSSGVVHVASFGTILSGVLVTLLIVKLF